MTGVAEERSAYRSCFDRLEQGLAAREAPWISAIRRAAISRFVDLGFPTTREEDWKYTNVAPLAQNVYELAEPGEDRVSEPALEQAGVERLPGSRLAFVDGFFSPSLSSLGNLPAGAVLTSLGRVLTSDPGLLEPHLARFAGYETAGLIALNTALMRDGAVLYLPRGAVLEMPIHLVFFSTARKHPTTSQPRTLIVLGEQCQASVVESYIGEEGGPAFTNAVTEVLVGENSSLDHYKIQRESFETYHLAALEVQQRRDSTFSSTSISLGGALVRNDIRVMLAAPGVDCTLNGLFLATREQHVDHHTVIDHTKPHGTSRELYKGVLGGRATGVFDGKVFVRPDAQQTNAQQTNRNLLLSEDAIINTKPQLEINANDVKCAHGSTTGQLSGDAVFYLRSRGLDLAAARGLLTYGFASEILGQVRLDPLRASLDHILRAWLPEAMPSRGAS